VAKKKAGLRAKKLPADLKNGQIGPKKAKALQFFRNLI